MKKIIIILGGILLLGLVALPFAAKYLAPQVINVPPPSGKAIGKFESPRAESSLLAIRVQIPVEALAQAANKEAPRQVQGSERKNIHKRISNGAYAWRIDRGSIRLQNTGQSLAFSTPIEGVAQASGNLNIKILQIPLRGTAQIGGIISGTINPQVAPNWQIIPNLVPRINLSKADLRIGQLGNISIRDLLQGSINPIIQQEAQKISPKVVKELDLKGEIQKLWDEAHVSDQVSKKPPIWINVKPNAVIATPLDYSVPEEISTVVAIQSQTSLTNSPPSTSAATALPNLQIVNVAPKTELRIPFIVSIARLNQELAKENFSVKTSLGTKIDVKGVKVIVGQNGFVNFSLNLNAQASKWNRPTKGVLWFQGKPIIDYDAQVLVFSEVDFTLETKDTLTTMATWLLEGLLVKSIEKGLRVDLNDYKAELDEELAKALKSDDIPKEIEVSVKNLDVKLAEIYTITKPGPAAEDDPGVVIVVQAKGEASTRLKSFK